MQNEKRPEPQLRIADTCSRLGISFVPWIQDFYSVAVAKLAKKSCRSLAISSVGGIGIWNTKPSGRRRKNNRLARLPHLFYTSHENYVIGRSQVRTNSRASRLTNGNGTPPTDDACVGEFSILSELLAEAWAKAIAAWEKRNRLPARFDGLKTPAPENRPKEISGAQPEMT